LRRLVLWKGSPALPGITRLAAGSLSFSLLPLYGRVMTVLDRDAIGSDGIPVAIDVRRFQAVPKLVIYIFWHYGVRAAGF